MFLRASVLFSFITLLCIVIALATWVAHGQSGMNKNLEELRKIYPEGIIPNLGLSVSGILAAVVLPLQLITLGTFFYALKGLGNSEDHQTLL